MGWLIAKVRRPAFARGAWALIYFPRGIAVALWMPWEAESSGMLHEFPGPENPADGLAREKSAIGLLLNWLETGAYRPGRLEQLRGGSFLEKLL